MAVTSRLTNLEICTAALRKIGVVSMDEEATAAAIETARLALRTMLKSWQNRGVLRPLTASQSVTLTTNAAHTLDPVRPLEIQTARFKRNGTEIPMERMTREEYDTLPNKTTTGTPTQFYYDRQVEAARVYVWPVLSAASGETMEITYTREFEDVDLNDYADFPGEMEEAVIYNLADNLAEDFSLDVPRVTMKAAILKDEALAFDREGSVFFAGEYAE